MRPLDGFKVIEMGGLPTADYCCMLLSDFGADVVIVDRTSENAGEFADAMPNNPLNRGKRTIRVNIKKAQGMEVLRRMICNGDVFVEPYRPGVMESLGLGPKDALKLNEGLIYARVTGWGQEGSNAHMAGHDINYIAATGALSLFKRKGERPVPPVNLLGDFAGGGMLCALGILLALMERNRSGKGQVVDAAMVDGVASLSTIFYGILAHRLMTLDIGTNLLDGGSPFYQTYETADGKYMAVGAVENKFYARLLDGLGLDPALARSQHDRDKWPDMIERFARIFKTKTRDEWTTVFQEIDACVSPVLELNEVAHFPSNLERGLMIEVNGLMQPGPAPRLSRTPGIVPRKTARKESLPKDVLKEVGFSDKEISDLLKEGIVE